MPLTVVLDLPADDSQPATGLTSSSLIDEIVREGVRKMLAAALRAEVDAYIAAFADERDEQGRRLVVRNGYHAPREILTAAGAIEVKAPRVNDKRIDETTGEPKRFSSAILPPWCRKTPWVTEGPGSRAAGLAMAFKLIESAQARWRAVNPPHLVALVRAGAHFERGRLVERQELAA